MHVAYKHIRVFTDTLSLLPYMGSFLCDQTFGVPVQVISINFCDLSFLWSAMCKVSSTVIHLLDTNQKASNIVA